MSIPESTAENVLKALRALMPRRPLGFSEACQRAEAQANRLLDLHGLTGPAVPSEIVTELPRIRVEEVDDIPVSGSAFWDSTSWVLTLNAEDCSARRRFSLMHEFKHVVDHPFRRLLAHGGNTLSDENLERVADYFAACVLMPKRWVKRAIYNETQSVEQLAELFEVSRQAMSYRLDELGLSDSVARRGPYWRTYVPSRPNRTPRSYHGYLRINGAE